MSKVTRLFLFPLFLFLSSQTGFSAVYTVTKIADTNDALCNTDCSLREAIAAANATPDNDIIVFSSLFSSPQTITLGGTDLIITNAGSLSINGPGKDKLTVSGNSVSRVFTNNTGSVATIRDLRVTSGNGSSSVNAGRGGGVYNSGGNLTLENIIISGNTTTNGGGTSNAGNGTQALIKCSIFGNSVSGSGGAMQNFAGATLNIRDSSIYNNTANSTSTGGGAIQANGTMNIANTTLSGNNANGGNGGAIFYNGTALTLNNVTIAGNTATGNGGGIQKTVANPMNIRNSIIANNTGVTTPDIGGVADSQGNNIIGNVATSTGWVASDLQNVNPKLAPFGFYGETGLSYALLSGSSAINGGQVCVSNLSCAAGNPLSAIIFDQRGAGREIGNGIDIGAYETASNFAAPLPNGTIGQPYSKQLIPDRGAFSYSVSGGSLPPGISLAQSLLGIKDGSFGASPLGLAGTPTQTGTFIFTITGTSGAETVSSTYIVNILTANPTVSISGRISLEFGRGNHLAVVSLSDAAGNVFTARTNHFGRYRFYNIPTGQFYTMVINSKLSAAYPAPMIFTTGDLADFNISPILP